MLSFGKREDEQASINLTSLIDVIFILLIFFMISTQFKSSHMQLELPTLRDGSSQESGNPLVISVDKDQNIFLGDRIVALSDLNILLGNMRSEPLEQSLVLDCHREIPIEFVLELMGEVKNAGYPNIIFRHNKTDN